MANGFSGHREWELDAVKENLVSRSQTSFQFYKCRQRFIRTHDETFSVAGAASMIKQCAYCRPALKDEAPIEAGFGEIVSNDLSVILGIRQLLIGLNRSWCEVVYFKLGAHFL